MALAVTVGEEAAVADALETVGQGVEKEAAEKLVGGDGHLAGLRFAVSAVVLVLESDVAIAHIEDALVGDGDAVRITAEIFEDVSGTAEGRFGVNDPISATKGAEKVAELLGIAQIGKVAEEVELAMIEGGLKSVEEEAAEQTGEDADGKEEAGAAGYPAGAVVAEAAARDGAVDVRVMAEVLTPGVEDGEEAEVGAEVFGVASDGEKSLGNRAEEDAVNDALVLESDAVEFGGDGKDDVEVGDREEFGFTASEPAGAFRVLTL